MRMEAPFIIKAVTLFQAARSQQPRPSNSLSTYVISNQYQPARTMEGSDRQKMATAEVSS